MGNYQQNLEISKETFNKVCKDVKQFFTPDRSTIEEFKEWALLALIMLEYVIKAGFWIFILGGLFKLFCFFWRL